MLFPVRQQTLQQFTGNAVLGGTITFALTRDFFLDSLFINIPITVGGTFGTAATWSTMGLVDLVQRVQLQISDGSSNRNQTDASGGALVRRAATILSGLNIGTLTSLGATLNKLEGNGTGDSAGNYLIRIPLLFRQPQLSDPISSALLLPMPRYNVNPNLVITFGAKANMILSGATGATIAIGNSSYAAPWLTIFKRQVDTVTFPTLDTEFRELSTTYSSTGPNQLQEIDPVGSYTNIDYFMTNSSGVGADLSGGNLWQLQILSQVLRQFILADLAAQQNFSQGNDLFIQNAAATVNTSFYTDYFPGYFHQTFLHDGFGAEVGELGSVLNANVLAGSGTRIQILQNLTSTGTINYALERIFGDLSPYSFSFMTPAG
jgi:hypothetical protein